MPRPKSWSIGYARTRERYNLTQARRRDAEARFSESIQARYQTLYDWPSLYRDQANIYKARAAWWKALANQLDDERTGWKDKKEQDDGK